MSERYIGKVVHISDKYTVVIDAGTEQNVNVGMKFLVVGLGDIILDPETEEELEKLEIVRGRAEVVHAQAKISTIRSIEFDRQPDKREIKNVTSRSNAGLFSLLGPQNIVTESITPSVPINLELKGVKVGDLVIKL